MQLTGHVLAILFFASATTAGATGIEPIAPAQSVAGVSQEDWSRRWWEWAWSFDESESPVADRTGRFCANGQSGDVWFLAGTYGTQRAVRTCRVPRGKRLFFPLINYVTFQAEGSNESCMSLMARAARLTKNPSALVLEVDGVRFQGLQRHLQATKRCFRPDGSDGPLAAASGYYVALPPLAPGEHVLNFGGILLDMSQAVTYTLIVE
jgi:hypothetical protein